MSRHVLMLYMMRLRMTPTALSSFFNVSVSAAWWLESYLLKLLRRFDRSTHNAADMRMSERSTVDRPRYRIH